MILHLRLLRHINLQCAGATDWSVNSEPGNSKNSYLVWPLQVSATQNQIDIISTKLGFFEFFKRDYIA